MSALPGFKVSRSLRLTVVALLCLWLGGCAKPPVPAAMIVAAPEPPFPTPVVELSGGPAELGALHGQRLGDSIRLLHEKYLGVMLNRPAERYVALLEAAAFENRLRPEHRDEVEALAAETGLNPREAMLGQCFLDMLPMIACSTVTLPASAAPDGIARFGRNLDFPSLNVADKYTTVFIYRPQGRYKFASVGWPGLIGVLSGMNEHGLALANMEVTRSPRLPSAMPYTLLYRTILENCRTVDEAIDLLRKTPRQTANNLMLMDASGARAVVEISPDSVIVRRGVSGAALISTNHRRGQDTDTPGRCARYDILHERSKAEYGGIGVAPLEAMLKAASQKDSTLQSMVFEPQTRVLYLAAGQDAAALPFYKLDLKKRFSAEQFRH